MALFLQNYEFILQRKVNPLIGIWCFCSAHSARMAHVVAQQEDLITIYCSMPWTNVAGVIGSAVVTGVLLSNFQ